MEEIDLSFGKLIEKLQTWLDTLVAMLPNLVVATLVVVIGWFLSRYIQHWVERTIRRFTSHESVIRLGSNIVTVLFVLFVLFVALRVLNLDTVLTTILASAGVVGLAIGLALQDPMVNLFAGVMMSVKKTFEIGDMIATNGYTGRIERISLRSTTIRTPQGEYVIMPNKDIYHNPVKNFTSSGERRVQLACGVSYGDDLATVRRVATQAVKDRVTFDQARDVELFFTEFGDSSINFTLRFWLNDPTWIGYVAARSEAIIAVKSAFDEADIMIPFPIRTLDFGIRGGEKLDEVLGRQGKDAGGAMTESVG